MNKCSNIFVVLKLNKYFKERIFLSIYIRIFPIHYYVMFLFWHQYYEQKVQNWEAKVC